MKTFELGNTVVTSGIDEYMKESAVKRSFVETSLGRHQNGDWGNLGEEDKKENDDALKVGNRLLSSYIDDKGTKIWIITEWDRSVTTVLFPSEY